MLTFDPHAPAIAFEHRNGAKRIGGRSVSIQEE
jgi:hypothetical protein